MNDVLPKPFTKEGLLSMLEKHLGHLKKPSPGLEPMAPPGIAKASMKSEDSPATSPATLTAWNSPGNLAVVSPVANQNHTDDYGPPIAAAAAATPTPFAMQPGMMAVVPAQPPPGAANMTFSGSPPGAPQPGLRQQLHQQQAQQAHKRQISEISGGDLADVRRHQGFVGQPPITTQQQQQQQQQQHLSLIHI